MGGDRGKDSGRDLIWIGDWVRTRRIQVYLSLVMGRDCLRDSIWVRDRGWVRV